MTSRNATEEISENILVWMNSIRACVQDWIEPGTEDWEATRPPLFELSALRKRHLLAVPFIDRWSPSINSVADVFKPSSKNILYATGVHQNQDPVFSSSMEVEDLDDMMMKLSYHCVLAPRDESFMILNTYLDYWIVVGPHSLVEKAAGGSVLDAFVCFEESVARFGDRFEAGPAFSKHIVKIYSEHNRQLLSSSTR